jgi:hypothetical protein
MDVASDRRTMWLRKASSSTGSASADHVEVLGVDLRTGGVAKPGRSTSILADDLAISPDGTSVAGREFATIDHAAPRLGGWCELSRHPPYLDAVCLARSDTGIPSN